MIAPACTHSWKKNGIDRLGKPRLRCTICGKSITVVVSPKPLGPLRTDLATAAKAVEMLCEGMSVRSTSRLTGLDKNTIVRIVVQVGRAVAEFSETTIKDMRVDEVECDELWGFCYCKKTTQHSQDRGFKYGDIYTYLAIDRNTKLILTYNFGKRYTETGAYFMQKLKACTAYIGQLSTDGWASFPGIVALAWGNDINYGQITKIIAGGPAVNAATRYSPGRIRRITKRAVIGEPAMDRVSTSIAERANLSIRTCVRRMTRLTNGFSKKWENHEAMMSLFFGVYNFCKVHSTLKTTPAVAAGLTDHVWTVRELLEKTAETH